jgi:hypothetical protein
MPIFVLGVMMHIQRANQQKYQLIRMFIKIIIDKQQNTTVQTIFLVSGTYIIR